MKYNEISKILNEKPLCLEQKVYNWKECISQGRHLPSNIGGAQYISQEKGKRSKGERRKREKEKRRKGEKN